MMRLKMLVLATLRLVINLYAQNHPIEFEHISLEQGLSQTFVSSIIQDRQGFLWFGTTEGLNQYDGYVFTIYKYHPHDPGSLPSNFVTAVYEDRAGTLWAGTLSGGLNQFDRGKKTFTNYRHNPNDPHSLSGNAVTAICEDRSGALWIGTVNAGLNKLVFAQNAGEDRKKATFVRYQHDPSDSNSISHDRVTSIYEDHSGTLWIGTDGGGLNRLVHSANAAGENKGWDQGRDVFVRYLHNPALPQSLSSNRVGAIGEDRSGTLWIGTYSGGLNQFDRSTNTFRRFEHLPQDPNSLRSNSVTCVYGDKAGTLWIGTDGAGLFALNPETNEVRHYRHDPANPFSLSSNFIWRIYEDRSGMLWIGTASAGLNKFAGMRKNFRHYSDPHAAQNAAYNVIFSIYQDRRGILWVGSAMGVDRFDRQTSSHTRYQHDPKNPNSLSHNGVHAFQEDIDSSGSFTGKLWIGTRDGLDLLDEAANRFRHYRHDPNDPQSLSGDFVTAIYLDESNCLWIGTEKGLNKLERERGIFMRYPRGTGVAERLRESSVLAILEDRANRLWIGTGSGLIMLDHNREKFSYYAHDESNPNSLSHPYVFSLYEDAANGLWIGTYGGGLNKLDLPVKNLTTSSKPVFAPGRAMAANNAGVAHELEAKFAHFTEEDGLANNTVYGILGDDKGHLWLSTNRGLSKFNPAAGAFKNYDVADGLQSYEFNSGAYYKSKKGEMFFGGINGFNSFFPDSIKDNPYIPPVVLTAFKKFDRIVPLDREISEVERLDLSYRENFSFEFVALDYTNPLKNQYAYQLEGFDRDWVYSGARRYASYTNLDPGNYVFRVKGSNSDGVWNEEGAALEITIHPPFWRTWWFALVSSTALMAGAFLFHIYSMKRRIRHVLEIESARAAENERVRKQVADDFHDELGQKLTHISIYSELLKKNLEDASPNWRVHLNKINAASLYLSGSISNFIWALDPEQDSLHHLAVYLKNLGDESFHEAGIHFQVSGITDEMRNVKLPMHWRRHLTLIVKEGINNILKHAACQHVELTVAFERDELTITLMDDGNGFDHADCQKGEGIRKMKWRAKSLQGALEVISTIGKGTKVLFKGQCPGSNAAPR
jgi:ligand-binding sensor domain-containing protein/signal transduction histidine kinase